MHRRNFARLCAAHSLAACLTKPLCAFGPHSWEPSRNGIGLQLWTVRNQLESDKAGTLKAVAAAGYQQIELMDVSKSAELVRIAKDLGLEVRSAFFNWESIVKPNENTPTVEQIIDQAKFFDLEYLVFGYIGKTSRDTADKIRQIADQANQAAEAIAAAGMKMCYHNHSFEFEKFEGDSSGFDILVERFDKRLVQFELDVFWAAIAGWDPVAILRKLGPRVGQVHLKDLKAGISTNYDESQVPADAFQEVGDGTIDMRAVMKEATAQGVAQFHVEQDESPDPIASIGQSIDFITGNLW